MSHGIVSPINLVTVPFSHASQSHGGDTGRPRCMQHTQQICIWDKKDKLQESPLFHNDLQSKLSHISSEGDMVFIILDRKPNYPPLQWENYL